MRCFPFHDWGTWVTTRVWFEYPAIRENPRSEQLLRCNRCGKIVARTVQAILPVDVDVAAGKG